ncbi:MAG: Rrf2 family transcriptional regulator [Candidatus Levybacteria bacterium]|nr:Rrf2 family transcriptional regulator [Candidatus Levybacteria bacterium]
MIKFSRSEDYAVILVHALAKQYNKRLVPLSEIAKKYDISILFLRNLANVMVHAGLIKAVEGKNGGYFLAKDPKTLKVGEVLRAFSHKQMLLCCPTGQMHDGKCPKEAFCETKTIWRRLNEEFLNKVSDLSLEEFMRYRM